MFFFFFWINNSLGSVNKKKKDAPLKDVPHELLEKIEKRQIELFVEFLFHQSEVWTVSFRLNLVELNENSMKKNLIAEIICRNL